MELQRLAGRADKVTQDGDIRSVGSDAPGVNWKTEALRHIQVHACIVQFRKAETRGGQNAVKPRRINGPRRAMALPRAARQIVKLLPIAFVPRIHRTIQSLTLTWMQNSGLRFTYTPSAAIQTCRKHLRKYLLVYLKPPRMKEFLGLLYQTRQPAECFGGIGRRKTSAEERSVGLR